ncbi:hypothetical protein ACFL35_11295 [Candidatus Riflebacteria bacterium]
MKPCKSFKIYSVCSGYFPHRIISVYLFFILWFANKLYAEPIQFFEIIPGGEVYFQVLNQDNNFGTLINWFKDRKTGFFFLDKKIIFDVHFIPEDYQNVSFLVLSYLPDSGPWPFLLRLQKNNTHIFHPLYPEKGIGAWPQNWNIKNKKDAFYLEREQFFYLPFFQKEKYALRRLYKLEIEPYPALILQPKDPGTATEWETELLWNYMSRRWKITHEIARKMLVRLPGDYFRKNPFFYHVLGTTYIFLDRIVEAIENLESYISFKIPGPLLIDARKKLYLLTHLDEEELEAYVSLIRERKPLKYEKKWKKIYHDYSKHYRTENLLLFEDEDIKKNNPVHIKKWFQLLKELKGSTHR